MVLQVLADPAELVDDGDAVRLQKRRRPDAGELEELRRADRAGGEDHLAAGGGVGGPAIVRELDADRAPAPRGGCASPGRA